jgi:glutamate dehydrogenase
MSLYVPLDAPPGRLRFKLLRAGELAPLSQSLPMLEHMGVQVLEERPYEIRRSDGAELWIDDFGMAVPGREEIDVEALRPRFQETVRRTWARRQRERRHQPAGAAGRPGLARRALLRAYMRYMRQATTSFSRAYMEQTMASHPAIAADLVALFHARFDPDLAADREASQARIGERIGAALDQVANLDEDRILRQLLALIQATLRTNFFQRGPDGGCKPVISFKIDPSKVPDMPEPRPRFEIFVYSPRVEGVHLRFGRSPAAGCAGRTGWRTSAPRCSAWSRRSRSRTPSSCRSAPRAASSSSSPPPPGDREALLAEGIACYQAYLRGLLDVTDNLDGEIVPPPRVVRHDADDAYLVVAADKGTARFSDIANSCRRPSTASGSTTPSPPAARSATTTRRWASPRAEPGSRSSTTSASSASTPRSRTSRSSASAT